MRDQVDKLRLARTEGVGPVAWRKLLRLYGSASRVVAAWPDVAREAGRALGPLTPERDAEDELYALSRLGGRMVFAGDPDYPPLLGQLADPPPALAVLGDGAALARPAVAVVGSRNASTNGRRIAAQLAEELAQAGLVVVSGMARGIDGAAHEGALRHGMTVACVAGGLDHPYPPEHAPLQARIAAGGAVVSEAPLGTAPQSRHFPRRNRVIAGLSLGTVVIEAAQHSGSLITARLALEANREVFAVPGSPLDPRCRGSNDLLRQGAHLTESVEDVLDHLPSDPGVEGLARLPAFRRARRAPELAGVREDQASLEGNSLAGLVGFEPTPVDALIRESHLPAPAAIAALVELELRGEIEALDGNQVVRL